MLVELNATASTMVFENNYRRLVKQYLTFLLLTLLSARVQTAKTSSFYSTHSRWLPTAICQFLDYSFEKSFIKEDAI